MIKMILDNTPRILIRLFIMFTAIYMFFTHGLFFGVLTALLPVAVEYLPKSTHKTTREFINEIDESGEHHE